MRTLAEKQFTHEGQSYIMAAVLDGGLPFVQVTQQHEAVRHVRAVSVSFPVKTQQGAAAFVEKATEDDLGRALVRMKGIINGAERVHHYLTQFNKPPASKPNYDAYIKHKRYRS